MQKNKKIVILGGGTGLSTLLRGIKYINNIELSAIVSVSDDGASTGTLRHYFTIPAIGDLRKVISSMSLNRNDLDDILEYRFKDTDTDLDGHAIGNLIILSQILHSKSFARGIANTCKMLNVQGQIIPVSNDSLSINSKFDDGTLGFGESNIHLHQKKIKSIYYDNENPKASVIAVNAITNADIIIIGIGSLYTSIIPNLIFPNMKKALKKAKAKIFYFSNIFTEDGETSNMTIMDHVLAIEKHTFKNLIDTIVVNKTPIPNSIIKKYNDSNQFICKDDVLNKRKIIYTDLLDLKDNKIVRHDEILIKGVVQKIINDICT